MAKCYIDQETLFQALTDKFKARLGSSHLPTWNDAFDTAKSVPTADVVEVVHASWVWNPDGMDWGIGAWVCGKCGSRPETWWNTVKECQPLRCSGSHYCGNCGADMRGDVDVLHTEP